MSLDDDEGGPDAALQFYHYSNLSKKIQVPPLSILFHIASPDSQGSFVLITCHRVKNIMLLTFGYVLSSAAIAYCQHELLG